MNKIRYVTIVYGSVFGEKANANMDPCLGSSCNLQIYDTIFIKNDSAYINIFLLHNGRTLAREKSEQSGVDTKPNGSKPGKLDL